jgi:molybdate transport system substrate-binding protein
VQLVQGLSRWLGALALVAAHLLCGPCPAGAQTEQAPVIAAAADLQFALTEIAEAFRKETGKDVKLAFGSSGNFARQLRQGAPYELFLAADESYIEGLARDGVLRDEGVLYAIGRIVLFVPSGSTLKADGSLRDLASALEDGRLRKFAIANPEHAPYGQRAEEALRHAGLWERIKDKLVFGENVAQAAQFAMSGGAQGGIIAYSLALSPRLTALGSYDLIPADWHAPLRQRMALSRTAGPVAEQVYVFATKPVARSIFRKYGFVLPGEAE